MNIELHIERLVLDGLPIERRDGAMIQASVEAELARLLLASGITPDAVASGAVPRVQGGALEFSSGARPDQLGRQIAQSAYQEVHRQFIK